MKILHYFLGFPPYRTGGLTKYAFDLMKAQLANGDEVMALWPGKIRSYFAEPKIKERRKVEGITNFELINPLPVSLDEGINEFEAFTKPCDISIYLRFLKKERPTVIHIHTLMGMHREFVQAANQLGIRTVMTSHDYFGICPKVTLFRFGQCCDNDNGCRNCIQCNIKPLSLKKIKLLQSSFYRCVKDTFLVKKIRKHHRYYFFNDEEISKISNYDTNYLAKKYKNLRAYYVSIYEKIDFIHFNSTVAEKIYKRYIVPQKSKVVSIMHKDIVMHERCKVDNEKKVIIYLAPAKPFKGWNVLKEACDRLWAEGEKIELRVYCPVQNPEPYMRVKEEGFDYSQLGLIMNEADVLVAPSIWYETFGFTVLEALSFKVPVIVSDHVGAKDIVGNNGVIVKAGDVNELKTAIKSINKNVVINIKSWSQFLNENYEMYGVKQK